MSEREEKVLEYVIHRMGGGARLEEVVDEEYVRRNLTRDEIEKVTGDPRLVHAVRDRMEAEFESGVLDPNQNP